MGDFYPQLTPTFTDFLSSHRRVVYVAFGQQLFPDQHSLSVLLTALVSSLQAGVIDGVIWATVQLQSTDLPTTILAPNGDPIAVASLIANTHPDIHFTTWAPQFAILNHTSTRLFISHGGAESINEALYTGTPLLLQPFFGDQPSNTAKLVSAGVALKIDRQKLTVPGVADSIRCLMEDAGGQVAANLKRMKALAQIGSHRVVRGADLIEEVMFGAVNRTQLIHLYSPDREMTWWKAGNYDLYFVLVVGFGGLVYGVGKIVMFAVKSVANRGTVKVKRA